MNCDWVAYEMRSGGRIYRCEFCYRETAIVDIDRRPCSYSTENKDASESQIGGSHYKDMAIQPWEVQQAILTPEEFRGYLKGCIIKYSMRAGQKIGEDPEKEAAKARHYAQKLSEVWNAQKG